MKKDSVNNSLISKKYQGIETEREPKLSAFVILFKFRVAEGFRPKYQIKTDISTSLRLIFY